MIYKAREKRLLTQLELADPNSTQTGLLSGQLFNGLHSLNILDDSGAIIGRGLEPLSTPPADSSNITFIKQPRNASQLFASNVTGATVFKFPFLGTNGFPSVFMECKISMDTLVGSDWNELSIRGYMYSASNGYWYYPKVNVLGGKNNFTIRFGKEVSTGRPVIILDDIATDKYYSTYVLSDLRLSLGNLRFDPKYQYDFEIVKETDLTDYVDTQHAPVIRQNNFTEV